MTEWKEVRLGDVCSILGDGIHGTPVYSEKGEYYFINGNNLCEGHIVFKQDTKRVSEEEYQKHKKNLNNRTLLFSINGTVGNVAKYNGEPCILGKSACYFNVVDTVDKDYIYYVVSSPTFVKSMSNLANGTTIKNVSLKQMREKTFLLPPTETQYKISSILSSLDDKIAVNRRICENLEAQAQALFKNWFVDFAPFKNGKFVESELGMIPEGWRVGRLGDLTIEVKKKVGSSNAKVLSPINTGKLVLSDDYFSKQVYSKSIRNYIVVEPNDFAYNPARVNIGSIGRNEYDFIGCVSPVYVVFHCHKYYHYFIDFFRKTQYFKKNVNKLAIGGVRQTLRYEDMARIAMVIPPVEIVVSYNDIYESMYVTIKQLLLENSRLSTLRDTLLPKLMSGELEINNI